MRLAVQLVLAGCLTAALLPNVAWAQSLGSAADLEGLGPDGPVQERQSPADRQAEEAAGRLAGTWRCTGAHNGATVVPVRTAARIRLFFDGDTFLLIDGREKVYERGTFRVAPAAEPARLTLDSANADDPIRALYRLEDDRLSLQWRGDGARLESFAARPDRHTVTMSFRRLQVRTEADDPEVTETAETTTADPLTID